MRNLAWFLNFSQNILNRTRREVKNHKINLDVPNRCLQTICLFLKSYFGKNITKIEKKIYHSHRSPWAISPSHNNPKTVSWHSELFHRKQTSIQSIRTLETQIRKLSSKTDSDMKDGVTDKTSVKRETCIELRSQQNT